jgi:hypothetical protein
MSFATFVCLLTVENDDSLSPTDPASGTSANRIRVDSPPVERKLQYFARLEGLLLLYFALVDFNCHYQRHSV